MSDNIAEARSIAIRLLMDAEVIQMDPEVRAVPEEALLRIIALLIEGES